LVNVYLWIWCNIPEDLNLQNTSVRILAVESSVPLAKLMSDITPAKRHCKNYGTPFIAEIFKPKSSMLFRFVIILYWVGHISVPTIKVECQNFKNECT
jgi:hypothetical protein